MLHEAIKSSLYSPSMVRDCVWYIAPSQCEECSRFDSHINSKADASHAFASKLFMILIRFVGLTFQRRTLAIQRLSMQNISLALSFPLPSLFLFRPLFFLSLSVCLSLSLFLSALKVNFQRQTSIFVSKIKYLKMPLAYVFNIFRPVLRSTQ